MSSSLTRVFAFLLHITHVKLRSYLSIRWQHSNQQQVTGIHLLGDRHNNNTNFNSDINNHHIFDDPLGGTAKVTMIRGEAAAEKRGGS